ncbi:MAG: sulfotransferase domain-containing protein [Pirellulaceae bacterium]|nr:sulfotransferase domain-containing protein [Pirellulaceae bacterium]
MPCKLNWLASFPKSGNTWVRAFLAAYSSDSTEPLDLSQLNRVSHSESKIELFSKVSGKSSDQLTPFEINALRSKVQEHLACSLPKQCVIKTHNAFLMRSGFALICRELTRAAVYIVRNPLDVVDSLADHANMSIDAAIGLMNNSNHRLGGPHSKLVVQHLDTWSGHVQSWMAQRDFPILMLRYEDLKTAPSHEFEKLIRFLEWDFDRARLERAIGRTDFASLSQMETQTGFVEKSQVAKSGRFFRRGEVGTWTKILTSQQIETIVEHHASTMLACGYPINANSHKALI